MVVAIAAFLRSCLVWFFILMRPSFHHCRCTRFASIIMFATYHSRTSEDSKETRCVAVCEVNLFSAMMGNRKAIPARPTENREKKSSSSFRNRITCNWPFDCLRQRQTNECEEGTMKIKILLLSAAGIGAGLIYALESAYRKRVANDSFSTGNSSTDGKAKKPASMAKLGDSSANPETESAPQIDDRGTDQAGASEILKHIRDGVFEASDEKLALALGRPTEEIEEWTHGGGAIDGDVVMKARALALERGLAIE
jgi:hypothetical protein